MEDADDDDDDEVNPSGGVRPLPLRFFFFMWVVEECRLNRCTMTSDGDDIDWEGPPTSSCCNGGGGGDGVGGSSSYPETRG